MENFWNERYRSSEYVYGIGPNQFLSAQLETIPSGKILFPCEGEGRNAVCAAQLGWETLAFDFSKEGKTKAMQLAAEKQVSITYHVSDAKTVTYPEESFDVIALIYSHFPIEIRRNIHRKMIKWLKPGGILLLEAFNPMQLKNTSGGPKDLSMLYTEEMLSNDFITLKTTLLETSKTILNEGNYHQGNADIIRYIGIKI